MVSNPSELSVCVHVGRGGEAISDWLLVGTYCSYISPY